MGYGFVYLLGNESMPGLIKIGRTDRSPHLRASELSKTTGVPAPFFVYGYIEVEDSAAIEKAIHEDLKASRVNEGREFFRIPFADAWKHIIGSYDHLADSVCCEGEWSLVNTSGWDQYFSRAVQ